MPPPPPDEERAPVRRVLPPLDLAPDAPAVIRWVSGQGRGCSRPVSAVLPGGVRRSDGGLCGARWRRLSARAVLRGLHATDEQTSAMMVHELQRLRLDARKTFLWSWIKRISAEGKVLTITYTLPPLSDVGGGGSGDGQNRKEPWARPRVLSTAKDGSLFSHRHAPKWGGRLGSSSKIRMKADCTVGKPDYQPIWRLS